MCSANRPLVSRFVVCIPRTELRVLQSKTLFLGLAAAVNDTFAFVKLDYPLSHRRDLVGPGVVVGANGPLRLPEVVLHTITISMNKKRSLAK